MPIVPLRDLGSLGVITDVDPFDLPINAISFGKNIRFDNGRIERASVFRRVRTLTAHGTDVRHLIGYTNSSDQNRLVTVDFAGQILDVTPSSETGRTPSGWSAVFSAEARVTSCIVNNVVYINREDRVPAWRSKDSTSAFSLIPTVASGSAQWGTTTRCKALRSVAGLLVALNITEGAQVFPNKVKWSDFTQYNNPPPNWDFASTTSSAGENTLADMQGPIIDGLALKNRLMIYAADETWLMEYIGGNEMFRFDRQFQKGVISTNCVVEHNGLHYVFGPDDIWVHDGVSPKSIATNRVRRFIFNALRKSDASKCFVTHNIEENEIIFAYVSEDPYTQFPVNTAKLGCNRGAVYNYASDTWSFIDLSYVTDATLAGLNQGLTFDGITTPTDNFGGSFLSLGGDNRRSLVFGGDGFLRTYDPIMSTSSSFPIDMAATAPAFIERVGIDMDELKAELKGYKLISSVYPQGRLSPNSTGLYLQFSASDHPNVTPIWDIPEQLWDNNWLKCDFNVAGRFASFRLRQQDRAYFALSGYDFNIALLGLY